MAEIKFYGKFSIYEADERKRRFGRGGGQGPDAPLGGGQGALGLH